MSNISANSLKNPSGNYYFVVYNEDSKDFDIKKVEEKDWEHQEINRYER